MITNYYIDIFDTHILFCYCDTFNEVKEYVKTNNILKNVRNEILGLDEGFNGIVVSDDITNEPFVFFVRKGKFSNELLLHETNHLVHFYSNFFGFKDEIEFQAYLHESLFRNFRRLIQKK